jgi:hypothetical protein
MSLGAQLNGKVDRDDCERHRSGFWKEINHLKEAVNALKTEVAVIKVKLVVGGLIVTFIGSVAGAVVTQIILNQMAGK